MEEEGGDISEEEGMEEDIAKKKTRTPEMLVKVSEVKKPKQTKYAKQRTWNVTIVTSWPTSPPICSALDFTNMQLKP